MRSENFSDTNWVWPSADRISQAIVRKECFWFDRYILHQNRDHPVMNRVSRRGYFGEQPRIERTL